MLRWFRFWLKIIYGTRQYISHPLKQYFENSSWVYRSSIDYTKLEEASNNLAK